MSVNRTPVENWEKGQPGSDPNPVFFSLPGKMVVCDRCEGKGTHVNPNIDGHGITAEEWWGPDWDDESREMYRTGAYDVTCYQCKGKRVELVIDEEHIHQGVTDVEVSNMEPVAGPQLVSPYRLGYLLVRCPV